MVCIQLYVACTFVDVFSSFSFSQSFMLVPLAAPDTTTLVRSGFPSESHPVASTQTCHWDDHVKTEVNIPFVNSMIRRFYQGLNK